MKQIYALIVMLMMASVAFTGCVSDDEEDTTATVEETEEETGEKDEEVDYGSMTVPQLKDALKEQGLPVSGKKAELIERLKGGSK